MKDEAAFWQAVQRAFVRRRAFIRKLPAEGFAGKGTPDGFFCVAGVQGVFEAKYVKAWPKRPETPVTIELTAHQYNWLVDLVDWSGGRGFVLLGVANEWFLLRINELSPFAQELPIRLPQARLQQCTLRGTTRTESMDLIPGLVAQAAPLA